MAGKSINAPDFQADVEPCSALEGSLLHVQGNASERLASAIRFRTIAYAEGELERGELDRFRAFLEVTFPTVRKTVQWEVVGNHSLLLTWQGSDTSLQPYMLASHMDVVPVEGEDGWTVPPFAGEIRDGFIWGRGSMDDKMGVMAILEVLEALASRGWRPRRTIVAAFGHDEEVSGNEGAKAIAAVLAARGTRLAFTVDEGMPIAEGMVPGLSQPVALIGTSEKGWMLVDLRVELAGGHASMPASESAIGVLAAAVARLEANPVPERFGSGPEGRMLEYVARYMSAPLRFVISNLWLLRPVVAAIFAAKPNTNAVIRTTTAVTRIQGGFKDNALPSVAAAVVNHRVHPADTIESVLAHDRAVIADERVQVTLRDALEPAPISSADPSHGPYRAMQRAVRRVFPEALVAPALFIANSDTRHYWGLTDSIYRFIPAAMTSTDLKRIHGTDERMAVTAYDRIIAFYHHLVLEADAMDHGDPAPEEKAEL